jgi:phospholipid/cholesterol/gamma-HCH transport system substrate-binding protein
MHRSLIETILGGIVLIAAFAFLGYAYMVSDVQGVGGYPVHAYFERVDGMSVGDEVRMAGVKIGTVSALDVDPETYLVDMTMTLDANVQLYTDAFAAIQTEGLFGGKYVLVDPGGGEIDLIEPGDAVSFVQDSVILDELVQKIVSFAKVERAKANKDESE